MKKLILPLFIILSLFSISVSAQSYRVRDLADRLQTNAEDMAESAYRDFKYRSYNSKSDVEALIMAQQIAASARVFRLMVEDRRPESELRDASTELNELARRMPYSYKFSTVKNLISDISREVGGTSGGGWGGNDGGYQKPVIGSVRWKGTVDDEVNLIIRGGDVQVQTLSGMTYGNSTFKFTSSLPNKKVDIEVNKRKGRGSVRVIQEPRKDNDFTAVVQIRDKDGGAKDYDLEIIWR